MPPKAAPSRPPRSTGSRAEPAESSGVNLAVLCGPCSGPAEVRVLESGTRLATLAVRCPAGAGTADERATSVPVTVWDPPAWVETLEAGDADRRRGPDPAALLPAARRCGVPGRRRGRADRAVPATGAGSTPRCARPTTRSRPSESARDARSVTFPRRPRRSIPEVDGAVGKIERATNPTTHEPTQRGEGRVTATPETQPLEPIVLDEVVIRFAGDSGDGMQLIGDRFTDVSAVFGNDLATLPNYPAEIRAPAGTIAGVSSLPGAHLRPRHRHAGRRAQPAGGDEPGGAEGQHRRPAARRARSSSTPTRSRRATSRRPATSATRSTTTRSPSYRVFPVPMTSVTLEASKELGVKPRDAERSKNFFALGLISWMYTRPIDPTLDVDRREVRPTAAGPRRQPRRVQGRATTSARPPSCSTTLRGRSRRSCQPGQYRNITGNVALAYGLIAAGQQAKLPILYASYPITPASDILHELSKHKNFGVRTLQAEDEIAAVGVAIGARVRRSARRHRDERPRRRPQVARRSGSRSASSCRW